MPDSEPNNSDLKLVAIRWISGRFNTTLLQVAKM